MTIADAGSEDRVYYSNVFYCFIYRVMYITLYTHHLDTEFDLNWNAFLNYKTD